MAGTQKLQRERERSEDLVCLRTTNDCIEIALLQVFSIRILPDQQKRKPN